jgi:hypothetical protein
MLTAVTPPAVFPMQEAMPRPDHRTRTFSHHPTFPTTPRSAATDIPTRSFRHRIYYLRCACTTFHE